MILSCLQCCVCNVQPTFDKNQQTYDQLDSLEKLFCTCSDIGQLSEKLADFKVSASLSVSKIRQDIVIRVSVLDGLLCQRQGDLTAAEVHLNRVVEEVKGLDCGHLSKKQLDKVSSALHECSTNIAFRIGSKCYSSFMESILSKGLTNPGILIAQANSLLNNCHLQEAEKLLHYADNQLYATKNSSEEDKANVVNVLSAVYMFEGEQAKALNLIENALSQLKMSNRLLVNLWRKAADIHMVNGDTEKAMSALKSAIAICIANRNDHLQYTTEIREGILLSREGDAQNALQKFYDLGNWLSETNPGLQSLIVGNAGLVLERMRFANKSLARVEPLHLEFFKNMALAIDKAVLNESDLSLDFVERAFRVQSDSSISRLQLGTSLLAMYTLRQMEDKKAAIANELAQLYQKMFQGSMPLDHKVTPFGWDVLY